MTAYKETIFLPQTSFPMKANLKDLEPKILSFWEEKKVYDQLKERRKNQETFILHPGPPYANGHLHVGHALDFILKDIIVRIHQVLGKNTPVIPGWDCHGLPIEWKIEEAYRAKGINRENIPLTEFRGQCRDFARHWIDIQRAEFKRLGLLWDWDNAYESMDYKAEATILETLFTFLEKGSLYRGIKPVLWSVIEKTALAEAEVEYHDKVSTSVYVRFPVLHAPQGLFPDSALKNGISYVIWTTTPWTLPGNRALSYGPEIPYGLYRVEDTVDGSRLSKNEHLLIAEPLFSSFTHSIGASPEQFTLVATYPGMALQDVQAAHPFKNQGYDFPVPLLAGGHVTTDTGTGIVHTAPGHGIEDFEVCCAHQIPVPETVTEDGTYASTVPLFAGQHIFKIDGVMLKALEQANALVHSGTLTHSYPHSWRSKAPLIYRTTSQWFLSMSHHDLRQRALEEINHVQWLPAQGKNRIRGMVENRPDWCLSRQRAWGVPLAFFVNKTTKEPLRDPSVNQRILEAVSQHGADAWFDLPDETFLGETYSAEDFEKVRDILDVWFDAGCTQNFVLEKRPDLKRPADLYLEGSDQHRGWFQASLLVGCGTHENAPYKTVLTHGFVVDEKGHKMSKSVGNVLAPDTVIQTLGAEILRLWTASCDFGDDLRIGPSILKHQEDLYRRYRNTLRYILGALSDFQDAEKIPEDQMPDLERWVLHRLYELHQDFIQMSQSYDIQNFYAQLHTFCSVDLSAFYFDIRKDVLYCESPSHLKRRATRTVLDIMFRVLVHWLSPVLCFTAEEAWQARLKDQGKATPHNGEDSLQWSEMPSLPKDWYTPQKAQQVATLRHYRRVMTGALEHARSQGLVGSSLQAELILYDPDGQCEALLSSFSNLDITEVAIVSKVTYNRSPIPSLAYQLTDVSGLGVVVQKAPGEKCQRCWRVLEEVEQNHLAPHTHCPSDICQRCADIIGYEIRERSKN